MTSVTPAQRNRARLKELCQELLTERHLILASNRGPVEFCIGEDGRLVGQRGSGGVVTALSAVSRYADLTWIASAMGEGDQRAAIESRGERLKSPLPGQDLYLRFVVSPPAVYHKYYNVFCNPLLWFLQHYMWNSPYTPDVTASVYDAWEKGYMPVNWAFAEAIIAEAQRGELAPLIMLQDYHLYLAAGHIRERLPQALLQHFTHIPWPAAGYWQLLPAFMRQAICANLCANDIVGFQTLRDVRNFLHTCESFLPDAEVDYQRATVWYRGRLTRASAYPISIDVAELQRLARSPRVREYEAKLRPLRGEKTIVRVDRMEPSKNVVRGLRAYKTLLERYPELRGRVVHLAFLVPSRTDIPEYQRYTEEVNALIATLNGTFGHGDWQPVHAFHENNYPQAIAGMRLYDVLLVNPVIDGMNLVSKEGPMVNTRDGVVVLSEGAGSHEQLQKHVLSVAPSDIEGTAEALCRALTMPEGEKRRRAEALRRAIQEEDITMWLYRQFSDLLTLA